MSKFNSLFVATVNPFNGTADNPATPDKNGEMPVILNVVAGKAPNARVLSGTVANNANFHIGNAYLVSSTEGELDSEYGRRFTFNAVKTMTAMEVIEASSKLGEAVLVDVTTPKEEPEVKA